MPPPPTSYGLVHADFHAGNYLFYKGSVRFIDFEDLSWGYYLYDIATALFGLLERDDYPQLAAAFTAAYAKVLPLPAQLDDHIRSCQILRATFLASLVVISGSLAESKWWPGYVVGKLRRLLQV